MVAKMNHTQENVLLAISWVMGLLGYIAEHGNVFPIVLSCVASGFVIYEKYLSIKKHKNGN